MNSRERVCLALQRKEPDRVPKLEWLIDPSIIKQINPNWSYMDLIEHSVEDVAVATEDVKTKKLDEFTEIDEWGTTRCWTASSRQVAFPIQPSIRSKEDFEKFLPPDPWATYRFDTLKKLIKKFKYKKAICFFAHDAWEYPAAIRGEADLLMDFILDPEFAKRVIKVTVDYQVKMIEQAIKLGAEIIATGDDYSSTKSPVMSPKHFKEFILPGLQKVVDVTKDRRAFFIKHSDGNVWPILDLIVDTGLDAFNPIQPDAMDIREVKKRYGDKIAIVGNIDCGDLLCNASDSQVENVVRQTIQDIGPGGGYIVSSSNSIHAGVEIRNYMAMLKAVEKYGFYPL